MSERKPYPSDLSDEQWAVIEPVITAWKDRHRSVSGHQGAYEMREIVNSILYQGRTGCQWAYLPHDLPPKSATKRSPSGYGSGLSIRPLTTVKIAVADPIPTANATTASSATPSARAA